MARPHLVLPDLIRYPRWGAEVGELDSYNSIAKGPPTLITLCGTDKAATIPIDLVCGCQAARQFGNDQ